MSLRSSHASIISLLLVACQGSSHSPASPSTPDSPSLNVTFGNCIKPVSEISGPGSTFPETLVREGVQCNTQEYAEERHCPGVYVAIARGNRFLGGGTSYYDGERRLFAAESHADYNAFCSGTSFNIIYGTIPKCPGPDIVTDLCRR